MNPAAPDLLGTLLEDAALTLSRLAGGAAVCTFSRAGVPVPGIKYAEGRWAALRGVQRAALRGADLGEASSDALATWSRELESAASREHGRDWIAYRTGGVDAICELLDRHAAPSPGA